MVLCIHKSLCRHTIASKRTSILTKPAHSIVYFITDAVDFMIEVDRPSLEVTPTTKRLVLLIVACCVGLCVLFLCSVSLIHFQLKKLSATLHLDLRPWHRNLAQIEVEETFICHVTKQYHINKQVH